MKADLSIIIVSYNNFFETTGPCLQSLEAVRRLALEIIVVDNGSDQATVEELKQCAARDPRIVLLLHGVNRGYAQANNDGVELATAPYIMLLNSDTLIPENVPGLLVKHLHEADRSCIVGPVTNAAGNEQQIYFKDGDDQTSILTQGAEWSKQAAASVFLTDQLSFFCVAMEKRTYLELGGLDTAFGLGFYEDTDFCNRAVQKKISLHVLEECFVYHQGSASFSRAPFSVKELLAENRKKFRKKYGNATQRHVRWKNLKVLQGYLTQMQHLGIPRDYLFYNRMARARQLMPRNPVKKIGYAYQLHTLQRSAGKHLAGKTGSTPV